MKNMSSEESSDEFGGYNYYKEGLISKIEENIYLTDVYGGNNLDKLKEYNIGRIINLGDITEHKIYKNFSNIEYLSIVIDDSESEDIYKWFEETTKFISTSNSPVLIYCWAGISRSVTILIAYLISKKNMSYLTSYFKIKKVRPFIHPNIGFVNALYRLENSLNF